jgi:hypothetical protein
MALSFRPFKSVTVTAALGSASAIPANLLVDNTKTLVFLNLDATNALWVCCDSYSSPPASLAAATSTVIPAGGAFTFDIGVLGDRGAPDTTNYNIYLQSAAGGAVSVNITAIQGPGSLLGQG